MAQKFNQLYEIHGNMNGRGDCYKVVLGFKKFEYKTIISYENSDRKLRVKDNQNV